MMCVCLALHAGLFNWATERKGRNSIKWQQVAAVLRRPLGCSWHINHAMLMDLGKQSRCCVVSVARRVFSAALNDPD
jgi:hypothetical protein